MERHESAANPASADRGDSVNPNPGDGASGPGEFAYEKDSQVGDIGGEAAIDLEEKARRMEQDPSADPATAGTTGTSSSPNPDEVTPNPEVQSGG